MALAAPESATRPRVEALGEDALLLRLGDAIDADTNARVLALAARLAERRPPWLREIVPAYASLALFVDLDAMADDRAPLDTAAAWALAQDEAPAPAGDIAPAPARVVDIPVRFGGDDGPDLADAAAHAGLAEADFLARFRAAEYRVAMIGFAPGFPYLLGLDPALALPRLATPRTRVPAGSVAIGGAQAGIYPAEGPGGWRLLGRTPVVLFDPRRDPPSLLRPGDRVRFVEAAR